LAGSADAPPPEAPPPAAPGAPAPPGAEKPMAGVLKDDPPAQEPSPWPRYGEYGLVVE